jgi:hypothetical protein
VRPAAADCGIRSWANAATATQSAGGPSRRAGGAGSDCGPGSADDRSRTGGLGNPGISSSGSDSGGGGSGGRRVPALRLHLVEEARRAFEAFAASPAFTARSAEPMSHRRRLSPPHSPGPPPPPPLSRP